MVRVVRTEWGEGREEDKRDDEMMLYLKRSTKGIDAFLGRAADTAQ